MFQINIIITAYTCIQKYNLKLSYQVELFKHKFEQTLRSRIAKGGIKRFLTKILSDEHDDTFVLTMQVIFELVNTIIFIIFNYKFKQII